MVTHALVDALKRKGRAPDSVLGRFGLPESLLADPYREVPLRAYVEAFEAAAVHTGDPDFGLFAARDMSPLGLGPVGLLFMSAPTAGAALKGFVDHIWLAQQGTTTTMTREGNNCVIRYRIEDSRIRRRRHDAEFSLALLVKMMRALAGPAWRPLEVHFEHAEPERVQAHVSFFAAPLYFHQAANELIFPAGDLAIAGNLMDGRVSPIVRHYLAILNERRASHRSLEDQVRRMVSDHFPGDGRFAVGDAAHKAGVSLRTLQRTLNRAGDSFAAIKEDKRRTLAENYLTVSGLSMTEIAHILGYADAACFTRACRRWFGMTPSAYRKKQRLGEQFDL